MRVIDSGTVSAAIAMLAFAIQRRLARGTTDEEIDELVTRFRAEHGLLFTLDTLENLARGGRIGRAALPPEPWPCRRPQPGTVTSIRPSAIRTG